jgi:DNA-binding IclR family transcriptional regulator
MSSTTKALELLSFFSEPQPEIGLSQMCRLAKRDKATTYRHLTALELSGFVEQNPTSKCYRLGPALLQLGRMREVTVPREAGVVAELNRLAQATGETAHVSVLSGNTVFALQARESPKHSTRAVIDITEFPLHATASGFCALAFGPKELFEIACTSFDRFTDDTPTTPDALLTLVDTARDVGFARSDGRFEPEIHSLSAPIFDQSGQFAGAVSVASVASRFTADLENTITFELAQASRDITKNWGGVIPKDIETAWARSFAKNIELDTQR